MPEPTNLSSVALLAKLSAAWQVAPRRLRDPLEHLRWVESGAPFEQSGIAGFLDGVAPQAGRVTGEEVERILRFLPRAADRPLGDAYMKIVPRSDRHGTGEYYTPGWLVELVLDRVRFDAHTRLVDPMCGAGAFLVAAIRRLRRRDPSMPAAEIARRVQGCDANPSAVLLARAEYLAALEGCVGPSSRAPFIIPVRRDDAILGDHLPDADRYDVVAGNPPWVGWESLSAGRRSATRDLWRHHGLFPDGGAGMQAMLGRGRKDLSMLATFTVADRLLRPGGRLCFVIAQGVFKSVGGGAGFRGLTLGDGTPLRVEHVDDFSGRRVFANAAARAAVVTLVKGEPTVYPVAWKSWGKPDGPPEAGWAEPVDPNDRTSAWLTGTRDRIDKVRRVMGPSSYRARAGAYTGGANGVYWVRELRGSAAAGTMRVANMPEAGKRKTPSREDAVERDLVYPMLRAGEVRRFEAEPKVSILLPKDPARRRGIDQEIMSRLYPLALRWFESFRELLAARRDRGTRSLIAAGAPFYTMFSVTTDTMAPWKVVWPRIASGVRAAAVGPVDGRPVVPQETCTFIACAGEQPEREALYLAGMLNSTLFNEAAASFSQQAGKSFGAPHLLRHIAVPRFDPGAASHQDLAWLVGAEGAALGQARLDEAAAAAWGITSGARRSRRVSRARSAHRETT